MTDEEYLAKKEDIVDRLELLADELGKLTLEVMVLNEVPVCKASIEVTNVMGIGKVKLDIKIPPTDRNNRLNNVPTASPEEQVNELFKSMKPKEGN